MLPATMPKKHGLRRIGVSAKVAAKAVRAAAVRAAAVRAAAVQAGDHRRRRRRQTRTFQNDRGRQRRCIECAPVWKH